MALTVLTTDIVEKSTAIITASFEDEDGIAVTPDTLTWTLTDVDGTVINSKEDEELTPATSVDIVLSGDDLAFQSAESGKKRVTRKLLVEGAYTSDAGAGLPIKDEVQFTIRNLTAVT